jgi:hypothetical protein
MMEFLCELHDALMCHLGPKLQKCAFSFATASLLTGEARVLRVVPPMVCIKSVPADNADGAGWSTCASHLLHACWVIASESFKTGKNETSLPGVTPLLLAVVAACGPRLALRIQAASSFSALSRSRYWLFAVLASCCSSCRVYPSVFESSMLYQGSTTIK